MARPDIIERAYQLAASGRFVGISPIKQQLKRENYLEVESHVTGAALLGELKRLYQAANARGATDQSHRSSGER
jgi:hypothetical protein